MAVVVHDTLLEPRSFRTPVAPDDSRRDASIPIVALRHGHRYVLLTGVLLGIGPAAHARARRNRGAMGRARQRVLRSPPHGHVERHHARRDGCVQHACPSSWPPRWSWVPRTPAPLAEASFLTLALLLEITVFLSVTFVVARPRPDVAGSTRRRRPRASLGSHRRRHRAVRRDRAHRRVLHTSNRLARAASALLAVIVVALVGFSRVYRGLHHPTDVFVGVLFGLACLVVRRGRRPARLRAARRNPCTEQPLRRIA